MGFQEGLDFLKHIVRRLYLAVFVQLPTSYPARRKFVAAKVGNARSRNDLVTIGFSNVNPGPKVGRLRVHAYVPQELPNGLMYGSYGGILLGLFAVTVLRAS